MNKTPTQSVARSKTRQKGTALMVAMVILIGITLLSLAGINTSILELRMARNMEASANTFQTAMAALDFIFSDPDNNLPVSGDTNVTINVTLPDDAGVDGEVFDVTGADSITATAVRLLDCAPPPRARLGQSLAAFSAFVYEASVTVDKNDTGNGRIGMAQGYILMGPKC